LASKVDANAGIPLSKDALIENHPWEGYRLNPRVLILATNELAKAAVVTIRKEHGHNSAPQV
jgi:hypothetical protein